MSTATTDLIDSNKMYAKLLECGQEWADTKAAYDALDRVTSSVLADLTQQHRDKETSRAEAETFAKASKPYRDHLDAVSRSHRVFLKAQVRYDSLKTLIELRRSEESTRRQEMRL